MNATTNKLHFKFKTMTLMLAAVSLAPGVTGCGAGRAGSELKTPPSSENSSSQDSSESAALSCADTTNRLKEAYAAVHQCQSDEDCNYIDRFFNVVSRDDDSHFVTTSDCTSVTPFLIVANAEALQRQLGTFTLLQKRQEAACALPAGTVTCLAFDGFTSARPPTCAQNKCRSSVPLD